MLYLPKKGDYMKKYRITTTPQPDNQMLLVSFVIHQCTGNYRFELFNKKLRAKRELRRLRKMRNNIDKDLLF